MFIPLIEQVKIGRRTRPDAALGDKAYSSRAIRSYLRKRRGSEGGRRPKFDSEKCRGRKLVERGYSRLKQWRGLATRYDKLATIYRGSVVLNGVIHP